MFLQEAWDSYIQNGNAVDPQFHFYPTLDQQLNSDGGDLAGFNNNIFMGANTPNR